MADEQDDPKRNPQHLANFPRGHRRDEESRRRTDALAEEAEKDDEAGSINTDALKPEREILVHLDPHTGNWPISKRRDDRYYIGVHKDNISISNARLRGFQPVQGRPDAGGDKEAEEFIGVDCASGTTLRGCGDVFLFWCPMEFRQKWEEENIRKAIAVGAIEMDQEGPESAWADDANDPRSPSARLGARAYGRRTDPKMQSTIFRGTAGQIQRLNEGIRTGNIPQFEDRMRGR